jgi:DNA-binding transcriptional MerR regulator
MSKAKQIALAFDFDTPLEPAKEEVLLLKEVDLEIEQSKPLPTNTVETILEVAATEELLVQDAVLENTTLLMEELQPTVAKIALVKSGVRGRKSIKAMEAEADLISIPSDEILFSKMYYTMNEVTQMFRANHSLIRFWENEFSVLQPRKNKKGDRLFRPEDIKNLEIIYYLLRVKKYTLEGAKDYLNNQKKHHQKFEAIQKLEALKKFLLEIKAGL